MNDINITIKTNKRLVLTLSALVALISVALIVEADLRQNVPNVLPEGTNVRAIVLNIHSGQQDAFNYHNGTETMTVQFQDMDGYSGSEIHLVEALVNFSRPAPFIERDIQASVIKEAQSLNYNLKEIIIGDISKVPVTE